MSLFTKYGKCILWATQQSLSIKIATIRFILSIPVLILLLWPIWILYEIIQYHIYLSIKIQNLDEILYFNITFLYLSSGITLFIIFFVLTVTIIIGSLFSNPFIYLYFIFAGSLALGLYLDYRVYSTLHDNGYVPCEDLIGFDTSDHGTTYGRSIEACLAVAKRAVANPEQTKQSDSPTTDAVD